MSNPIYVCPNCGLIAEDGGLCISCTIENFRENGFTISRDDIVTCHVRFSGRPEYIVKLVREWEQGEE